MTIRIKFGQKEVEIEDADPAVEVDKAIGMILRLEEEGKGASIAHLDDDSRPSDRLLVALRLVRRAGSAGLVGQTLATAIGVKAKGLGGYRRRWKNILNKLGFDIDDVVPLAPIDNMRNAWKPGAKLEEAIGKLEVATGKN